MRIFIVKMIKEITKIVALASVAMVFAMNTCKAEDKFDLSGTYKEAIRFTEEGEHAKAGEKLDAIMEYEVAKEYSQKGILAYVFGNYEEALELYNKALKINPKMWDVYGYKAYTLSDLGRDEEGFTLLNKAINDCEDDIAKGELYLASGRIEISKGKNKEALKSFAEGLKLDAKNEGLQIGVIEALAGISQENGVIEKGEGGIDV